MASRGVADTKVWDALIKKIDLLDKVGVKIGFLEDKPHTGADGNPSGLMLVELAMIHELGTPALPERSFLRRTFEVKASDFAALVVKLTKAILADKLDYDRALEILGQWSVREIQTFVRTNQVQPPTSDAATAAKNLRAGQPPDAPATTLVDTGQLINGVTYEVGDA